MSAFIQPIESYKRDYDIVGNYTSSMAKALSLGTGKSVTETTTYLQDKMKDVWAPKSPDMHVLKREAYGDRRKTKIDLLSYLEWVATNNHIMAPNMICYSDPEKAESFLSGFIGENLATRSSVKKQGQEAKAAGDEALEIFCGILQQNYKIRNNSISGALSSPHNPLYYASTHTSLTSVCRAITSYANACNEKFLASNRHYYTAEVTLENLAYIARAADLVKIEEAMHLYGIVAPTVEYVYEQVLSSTRLYWDSVIEEARILTFIKNMTDLERTAVSFIGDLHAIHDTNDIVVRKFFDMFRQRDILVTDPQLQEETLDSATDDDIALATILCADFTAGKKKSSFTPAERATWIGCLKGIVRTQNEYKVFIDAFISTNIVPSSIHSVPTVRRRAVAASDTDSSIFTTQKQVEWYTGGLGFDHVQVQAGAITAYLTSQLIVHTLALMSGQVNTAKDQLFRLSMKSEYFSKFQASTCAAKHYYMSEDACEGNVYAKPELVTKGVTLKSSKLPKPVRDEVAKLIWFLGGVIEREKGLSPMEIGAIAGKMEHRIKQHLTDGNPSYFRTEQIRRPESYERGEAQTQIVSKDIWNTVYGEKYGMVEHIPADGLKVSVKLESKTAIKDWYEKIGTRKANILTEHYARIDKKEPKVTTLLAPLDLLVDGKIHPELLELMNLRKMLYSIMQPIYMTLSTVSMDIVDTKFGRFYSDDLTEKDCDDWLPPGYTIDI